MVPHQDDCHTRAIVAGLKLRVRQASLSRQLDRPLHRHLERIYHVRGKLVLSAIMLYSMLALC
jgi:hypothetical protein